jgi:hypothetical protein
MFKAGDRVTPSTQRLTGYGKVYEMGSVHICQGDGRQYFGQDTILIEGKPWYVYQWKSADPATPAPKEGVNECKESVQDLMAYGCRCGSIQRYKS